jgi:WD40 repeat protein
LDVSWDEMSEDLPALLVVTRNGDMVELRVSEGDSKLNNPNDLFQNLEELKPTEFEAGKANKCFVEWILRSHSVQEQVRASNSEEYFIHNKVKIALHPSDNLMAVSANDCLIYLWNIRTMALLQRLEVEKICTSLKWNPNGALLFLGLESGDIVIYQLGKERDVQINPNLVLTRISSIIEPENCTAVLNMEFSKTGNFLAVSFDNMKVDITQESDEPPVKQDSKLLVYLHKDSPLAANIFMDENTIYMRYFEIRSPSIHSTFESKFNLYGMAAFYMAFSLDERYLLSYFQLIDNFQIRQNENREGIYLLWDNILNNTVKNWDGQSEAVFDRIKFPNHINGKFKTHKKELSQVLGGKHSKFLKE